MTSQSVINKIAPSMCDFVSSEIWNAYHWRDACNTFAPQVLQDEVQDYDSPPNFFKLVTAQIVRLSPTVFAYDPLDIKEGLPRTYQLAHPCSIRGLCLARGEGVLRLTNPVNLSGEETFELQGTYQLQHTKVTSINQETWFKDQLMHIAQEGMLYWAYKLADRGKDARDQYSVFRAKIKEASMIEDQGSTDTMYPVDGSIGSDDSGAF